MTRSPRPPAAVRLGSGLWLLSLLAGAASPPASAQPAASCAESYQAAEAAFSRAAFDTTIVLLRPCAVAPAPAATYRLLSLAYLNNGQTDAARDTVVRLLLAVPGYKADSVQDPPSYTVLVLVVREQLQQQGRLVPPVPPTTPWYQKRSTWATVGAGLVVIGFAALFAGG